MKRGDKYQFVMDNLPKIDGRYPRAIYHLIAVDGKNVIFSNLEPDKIQYQAEHFHMTIDELDYRMKEGRIHLYSRIR